MIDMYAIVSISLIAIFGLIAFKDWGEMELDWQAKTFKIKRRQTEYLQPNNLDILSDESSPRQLPKE
jgi:ABC-type phosphate transport system auxiliary subunit